MEKKCCRCSVIASTESFPKSRRGLHGMHSICKMCMKLYMTQYRKSGKLKIAKIKYLSSRLGQLTIKAYRKSTANKLIQQAYEKSPAGRITCRMRLATYRAKLANALPKWLSLQRLRSFYSKCPANLEVDHIIPINHSDVCGLHVPWNMQYLSRTENAQKSNSFDFTYNNESWKIRLKVA